MKWCPLNEVVQMPGWAPGPILVFRTSSQRSLFCLPVMLVIISSPRLQWLRNSGWLKSTRSKYEFESTWHCHREELVGATRITSTRMCKDCKRKRTSATRTACTCMSESVSKVLEVLIKTINQVPPLFLRFFACLLPSKFLAEIANFLHMDSTSLPWPYAKRVRQILCSWDHLAFASVPI